MHSMTVQYSLQQVLYSSMHAFLKCICHVMTSAGTCCAWCLCGLPSATSTLTMCVHVAGLSWMLNCLVMDNITAYHARE
jgi:hypothetical protein